MTLDQLVARIEARIDELVPARPEPTTVEPFGRGRQAGPLRLDYGPGWLQVACDRCGATWVGHEGDECGWCLDAVAWATPAPTRPASVPGWVVCPSCRYAWRGATYEVCGAHGGPWACNGRGTPLLEQDVPDVMRKQAA